MNTSPRVTTVIAVLIVACISMIGLHVSAESKGKRRVKKSAKESSPLTLSFSDAKLKPPYDKDADAFENDILKKYGKAYCVKHSAKPGHEYQFGNLVCDKKTSTSDQERSEIIAVSNGSPSPTPIASPSVPFTGPNVTQNFMASSAADMTQALKAFE